MNLRTLILAPVSLIMKTLNHQKKDETKQEERFCKEKEEGSRIPTCVYIACLLVHFLCSYLCFECMCTCVA